jgi:hypothetical protein
MSSSMFKSMQLPGCHHCIGAADAVADQIFRTLRSRAIANGGMISVQEIIDAHAQINESLSSSVDLFETINQECMEASESYASDPFSRDMIISTLLSAWSERSAARVFKAQIEKCGVEWLSCFFYVFGKICRDNLSDASKANLIVAYVDAAVKFKSNLSVSDLLNEARIKEILLKCIEPFCATDALDEVSKSTSDRVNKFIATKYNFTSPHIATITTNQIKGYFVTLQKEAELALRAASDADNQLRGMPR